MIASASAFWPAVDPIAADAGFVVINFITILQFFTDCPDSGLAYARLGRYLPIRTLRIFDQFLFDQFPLRSRVEMLARKIELASFLRG
jgi:hypothetical protein